MKILIIHGANLNMLGVREPELYGEFSLENLNEFLYEAARANEVDIEIMQTNSESEIIEAIHKSNETADFVILNAGAYAHTSYAIYDAILSVNVPVIEIHMTNIYEREEFRRKSVIAPACIGQITGFGIFSYHLAIIAAINMYDMFANIEEESEEFND